MFKQVAFNPAEDVLHLVGAGALVILGLKVAFCLFSKLYKAFLASPVDLTKYKGKWAVVTGGTDGIGKAFAVTLARKAVNVVLISRSQSKLDAVADELRDKFGVQVKTVAVDFVHDDVTGYKLKIARELEGLEIGVLINNVGVSYSMPARFLEMESGNVDEGCDALIKCNVLSLNAMTSLVLPQMVDRKSGVVINLSSFSGGSTTPYLTVYSATKAYVDYFSRGLAMEYESDGITVQSLLPGYVVSKLSKIRKSNFMTPYPDQYVRSALGRLGIEPRTTGYWVHDLMLYGTTRLLPQGFADRLVMSQLVGVRKRALKKQQQQSKSD